MLTIPDGVDFSMGTFILVMLVVGAIVILAAAMMASRIMIAPLQRMAKFAAGLGNGSGEKPLQETQLGELADLQFALLSAQKTVQETTEQAQEQKQKELQERRELEAALQRANEMAAHVQGLLDDMNLMAQDARNIAGKVTEEAAGLSEQVGNVSEGAFQQRDQTTQTATAMEEMNATVRDVAQNASAVTQQATESEERAKRGAAVVAALIENIASVESAVEGLSDRISELEQQAEGIGQVMLEINDIADQTNLLALNAAIEAARAGEAGRGFAVVADEVRKLAEKTMRTTGEVQNVVKSIQESTHSANDEMMRTKELVSEVNSHAAESGEALEEIRELATETNHQISAIATAAEEQSAASEQINSSVSDISGIATEMGENMENAAQNVLHLSGLAADMENIIHRMKGEDVTVEKQLDCWDYLKCGRERGGNNVKSMGICPASLENKGRTCAEVEGTFCGGKVQGCMASKVGHCARCDYFKSPHYERESSKLLLEGHDAFDARPQM